METDRSQKQVVQEIVAGRTLEEQMECVKKYGNHGFTIPSVLRGVILQALGACREPKQTAENLLMFGCYLPFSSPFMVRDCIRLLDLLGLDYTYLEQEFCCGSPMVQVSTGMERKRAIAMGKKFIQLNRDMAQQRGATTMAYCCAGCATMTKGIFPADKRHRHVYILDLIIEKLGKETLRVEPTVAGYFEGCHSRFRNIFPEVNLDWERYRQLLDRIEGLKIVDLPRNICCTKYPERTFENAEKRNLDTILCPCNGCYRRIGNIAKGRVQVKHLAEILLQSLGKR